MRTAIVYNFLIEANLMACLAIALMVMARRLRGKLGSRALTFGWGLIAVRLLCPLALPNPLINEIRSAFVPDQGIRPIAGQIRVRLVDAILWVMRRLDRDGAAYRLCRQLCDGIDSGRLAQALCWVWAGGMAASALYFLWRWRKRKGCWRTEGMGALCCVIHWFNPLVWLAARLYRADRLHAQNEGRIRRPLGAVFAAAACILLLGAFATAEKAPNLVTAKTFPAPFPVLSPAADDAAVIAHAESILSSPGFDQPTDGLAWTVIRRSGGWELEAVRDGKAAYEMMLLPTGAPTEYWAVQSEMRNESFTPAGILSQSMAEYARALLNRVSPGLADTIEAFDDAFPLGSGGSANGASIYGNTLIHQDEWSPGVYLEMQVKPTVQITGFRVEEALVQHLWHQGMKPLASDRRERLCGLAAELVRPYAQNSPSVSAQAALETLLSHLRQHEGETDQTLQRLEVRYWLDDMDQPRWHFALGGAYDASVDARTGAIVECFGFGEGNG